MRTWIQCYGPLRTKTQGNDTMRTWIHCHDTFRTRMNDHETLRTRTHHHEALRTRTQSHNTYSSTTHGHTPSGLEHGATVPSGQGHAGMSPSCPSPHVGEDTPSAERTLELPVLPGSLVLQRCGAGPASGPPPSCPSPSAAGTLTSWRVHACALVQDRWTQGPRQPCTCACDRQSQPLRHALVTGRDMARDNRVCACTWRQGQPVTGARGRSYACACAQQAEPGTTTCARVHTGGARPCDNPVCRRVCKHDTRKRGPW